MPSQPPELPPSHGTPSASAAAANKTSSSPFAPLSVPLFRMLWVTTLVANVCTSMSDVASAWLMTSLTHAPIWVALVQTASTIPVFLLALPSGALADGLDRRRYLLITQCWLAASATLLCGAVVLDWVTAPLLLGLTFINGVGLAMRLPVQAALVPETVPRPLLAQAIAVSGISMNTSRIVGPLLAGVLIAGVGIAWVFAVNAVLSIITAVALFLWKREHTPSPLGREPLWGAMRVGLQFVAQSSALRGLLLRVFLYFFHSSAIIGLLPLLAKRLGGGAGTFSLLLAAMGGGAIATALFLPHVRRRWPASRVFTAGVVLQSAVTATMALATHAAVAVPAMCLMGVAWMSSANSMNVSVQTALPDWVRARGMSGYLMSVMGGGALGAALWGQVATVGTLGSSLLIAAVSGLLSMLLVHRLAAGFGVKEDLSPSPRVLRAAVPSAPPSGLLVVTAVEYCIDPSRQEDFLALMSESRRFILRQGARNWSLLHDLARPERYVEQVTDDSWTELLRRFNRMTAADGALRERKLAFHVPADSPVVTRYVIEVPHS